MEGAKKTPQRRRWTDGIALSLVRAYHGHMYDVGHEGRVWKRDCAL